MSRVSAPVRPVAADTLTKMRRYIRIAGFTMVWAGLIVLGYAGYLLVGTDLINSREQRTARASLAVVLEERREDLGLATTSTTSVAPDAPPVLLEEAPADEGEPLGAIRIPSLAVDAVLFSGVDRDTLRLGPGHMPWTPVPGQPGNAVISGHRTTYGRPFADVDRLQPGDVIEVETAIGVHRFTVRESIIVLPTDVWVTDPRPGAWLTLTTCHPRFSARQRLVVFAELTAGPNAEYVAEVAGTPEQT
jgi:sortase A